MSKISVLLPERDNARFCAYCRSKGHKKSTFIAHLIKEHLDRESFTAEARHRRKPTQTGTAYSTRRGRLLETKSGSTP